MREEKQAQDVSYVRIRIATPEQCNQHHSVAAYRKGILSRHDRGGEEGLLNKQARKGNGKGGGLASEKVGRVFLKLAGSVNSIGFRRRPQTEPPSSDRSESSLDRAPLKL